MDSEEVCLSEEAAAEDEESEATSTAVVEAKVTPHIADDEFHDFATSTVTLCLPA